MLDELSLASTSLCLLFSFPLTPSPLCLLIALRSLSPCLSSATLSPPSLPPSSDFSFFHLYILSQPPSLFGQRPRRAPEGTKSCRIQGESVRPYVRTYVRPSVRPPPEAPQRLAKASQRLAEASQRPAQPSQWPWLASGSPPPTSKRADPG